MQSRWMNRAATVLTVAGSLAVCLPAAAQFPGQGGQPNAGGNAGRPGAGRGNLNRPMPKNYATELKTIADEMAKTYNVRIVVDPALFVAAAPKKPDASLDLEKAMDALTAAAKGAAWRKVYMSQAQGGVTPVPAKLVAAVRALDQLEQSGIVLENPATKKATTFLKDYAITPSFTQDLQQSQFSPSPIYVLYGGSSSQSLEDKFLDLQRQQMEMMMNMSPDQMASAMKTGMGMWNNLDPATRSQFMGNMMKAGMEMFQNMSPAERDSMMQSAMQAFQSSGIGGPGGPGGPGGGTGRRP